MFWAIDLSITKKHIKDAFEKWGKHSFFNDVRINMKYCNKRNLYDKGYKYCNNCSYMVKTDAYICPLCGRHFKTSLINKEHDTLVKLFSEPMIKVGVIKSDTKIKGVVIK